MGSSLQATHIIVTIPLDRWHEVMNNPTLWVESVEKTRRNGGIAAFDTHVLPCYSE